MFEPVLSALKALMSMVASSKAEKVGEYGWVGLFIKSRDGEKSPCG